MLLEIDRDALEEDVLADHVGEHAEHTGALGVGDGVKHLVDGVLDVLALQRHLDGVAGALAVEVERAVEVLEEVLAEVQKTV